MSITLKDLENFVTVAKSRTLSEASVQLDMAQPSLSLGIKKIETELKTALFIRSRDGIKLTPQGKELLPKAQEVLRLMDQVKGIKTNLRFKIGCHASVGAFMLGHFFKSIHLKNPQIDFEIINASSYDVNKMVARGEVDFGLVMNPLPIQGLVTKSIGEDSVHVWESKDRYQDKLIFNPQMLQSTSILSRWKNPPTERIEVQNLELIACLIHSGAGMGILPSQVVKALRPNLKVVPHTPSFTDKLSVICYPELLKSNEGRTIFETLKESFR